MKMRKNRTVRRADRSDSGTLARLAVQMWSDASVPELADSFAELAEKENAACFLMLADGQAVAFAQCGLRYDYVEGTKTSPVGYLEGIFVLPPYRNTGIAAELLSCCEAWAKEKNCTEFASDCELSNTDSLRFHLATGFEEVNRIICFSKPL